MDRIVNNSRVYCKLKDDKYDDNYCAIFIKEFSNEIHYNWITKQKYGNIKRFLFRKGFVCQHSSKNKAPIKKLSARVRDFKFKKVNKYTIKNELKEGLNW